MSVTTMTTEELEAILKADADRVGKEAEAEKCCPSWKNWPDAAASSILTPNPPSRPFGNSSNIMPRE